MNLMQEDSTLEKTPTQTTKEGGQSTIEFLIVFAFGVGFSVLFLNNAINSVQGYLVHYANFMASRTFLTHDVSGTTSEEIAFNRAEQVAEAKYKQYPLERFQITSEFTVRRPGGRTSLFSGTVAKFRQDLSALGIIGGGEATLVSESFLGKEPVRYRCYLSLCEALNLGNCGGVVDATLFDNGC